MKVITENGQFEVKFRYSDVYWIHSQCRWMEYDEAIENIHFSGDIYATKIAFDNLLRSKRLVSSKKTECIISRIIENKTGRERYEEVSHEEVIQDTKRDKYSKGKGRKESFVKAMKNFTSDVLGDKEHLKSVRLAFWRTFFENTSDQKQYLKNIFMSEFTKLPDNWKEIVEKNCNFARYEARYKQDRGYDD